MNVSLEHVYELWDDDHGEHLEVREDPDGLGLLELKYFADDGAVHSRITIPPDMVPHLLKAIRQWAVERQIGIEG